MDFRALTTKYDGMARALQAEVKVAPPLMSPSAQPSATRDCKAVWDTGATGTVITQAVVGDLGLQPVGFTQVHTANGTTTSPVYLIALLLPNHVNVNTKATLADLVGCDVLIGMDVIGFGDFSVTNVKGKTTVSFRVPSCEEIDYVQEAKDINAGKVKPPIEGDSRWERRHPGKARPARRRKG